MDNSLSYNLRTLHDSGDVGDAVCGFSRRAEGLERELACTKDHLRNVANHRYGMLNQPEHFTREYWEKMLPLIEYYAKGGGIEFKNEDHTSGEWVKSSSACTFLPSFDYRAEHIPLKVYKIIRSRLNEDESEYDNAMVVARDGDTAIKIRAFEFEDEDISCVDMEPIGYIEIGDYLGFLPEGSILMVESGGRNV